MQNINTFQQPLQSEYKTTGYNYTHLNRHISEPIQLRRQRSNKRQRHTENTNLSSIYRIPRRSTSGSLRSSGFKRKQLLSSFLNKSDPTIIESSTTSRSSSSSLISTPTNQISSSSENISNAPFYATGSNISNNDFNSSQLSTPNSPHTPERIYLNTCTSSSSTLINSSLPSTEFSTPKTSSFDIDQFNTPIYQDEDYSPSPSTPLVNSAFQKLSLSSRYSSTDTSPVHYDYFPICINQPKRNRSVSHSNSTLKITPHHALQIPEILTLILSFVDQNNKVPYEKPLMRRSPYSSFGNYTSNVSSNNEPRPRAVSEQANPQSQAVKIINGKRFKNCFNQYHDKNSKGGLFDCLLVDKFWNAIAQEILHKKIFFDDHESWSRFVELKKKDTTSNYCDIDKDNDFNDFSSIESGSATSISSCNYLRTDVLILHKMTKATQSDLDSVSSFIGGNLKKIEFYICPRILPTYDLIKDGQLRHLSLPGSKVANDRFLEMIARRCPLLETLDLRACNEVTDKGILAIANNCHNLRLLNIGRTSNGRAITDASIIEIARKTQITTVGIAGCAITDLSILELMKYHHLTLERLSLNGCTRLTNKSIPYIISEYGFNNATSLSVLELRDCTRITNLKPIVEYKRYREQVLRLPILIEMCEILQNRMRREEWELDMAISKQIFKDLAVFVNEDDTDMPFQTLFTNPNHSIN